MRFSIGGRPHESFSVREGMAGKSFYIRPLVSENTNTLARRCPVRFSLVLCNNGYTGYTDMVRRWQENCFPMIAAGSGHHQIMLDERRLYSSPPSH